MVIDIFYVFLFQEKLTQKAVKTMQLNFLLSKYFLLKNVNAFSSFHLFHPKFSLMTLVLYKNFERSKIDLKLIRFY